METRTSSSDNKSSSYKSNKFEGMQLRSNESQYNKKNGSGERRELEEKGTSLSRRIRITDHPVRRRHNKEDQFDPEEAGRNNGTDPTPRSKQGQAAGIPEAEVVNNSIARRGKDE
ncbi:hypothetical protein TNCV_2308471 [Trichonephila clavipes]|nr:hypothetical protein TNCV_2308471 [Trichonephila clavipes]